MTDKEQFELVKSERLQRKSQLIAVKFLKMELNRKLLFSQVNEEDRLEVLSNLRQTELAEIRLRRNRLGSKEYEFIPSGMFNRNDRKQGIVKD